MLRYGVHVARPVISYGCCQCCICNQNDTQGQRVPTSLPRKRIAMLNRAREIVLTSTFTLNRWRKRATTSCRSRCFTKKSQKRTSGLCSNAFECAITSYHVTVSLCFEQKSTRSRRALRSDMSLGKTLKRSAFKYTKDDVDLRHSSRHELIEIQIDAVSG